MNLPEKLAREIGRVTVMRCRCEAIAAIFNVQPLILLMDAALENAMLAAGIDDGITQLDAVNRLEAFTE
jgi:hypothetical protein